MSLRPGMHRGGRANPQHAEYQAGDHTPAQMRDLLGDPNFVVIRGGERLTTEMLDAADAFREAKEAEAATKPSKKA
jgi:hypothetical protein